MEQKLFTEIIPLYRSRKDNPYTIRIRIRLQDAVDPVVLRRAVDTTMERYPYFCVKLQTRGAGFIFTENREPVVISNSKQGVTLNVDKGAAPWYSCKTADGKPGLCL